MYSVWLIVKNDIIEAIHVIIIMLFKAAVKLFTIAYYSDTDNKVNGTVAYNYKCLPLRMHVKG